MTEKQRRAAAAQLEVIRTRLERVTEKMEANGLDVGALDMALASISDFIDNGLQGERHWG